LLVSAQLVAGRRLAAWPGIRDDVVHAGGVWRDEPLVRDHNWVTSRGPQDMGAFVPAMLELFARGPVAALATNLDNDMAIERVSSPQRDEPPKVAVAAARILPGPALPAIAGLAAGTALGALAFRSPSH
jgi:protease I